MERENKMTWKFDLLGRSNCSMQSARVKGSVLVLMLQTDRLQLMRSKCRK